MIEIELINQLSVFNFFIMTVMILLVVTGVAYFAGMKLRSWCKVPTSDVVSNNLLGLLAFILGFSFSLAISRYENRKSVTLNEANTINTTYLRSGLINFKKPDEVKELFKKYLDLRIEAYTSQTPFQVLEEIKLVQMKIWSHFKLVTIKERGELESAYMDSLNEMFDIANSRNFAFIKKLPASFYYLIFLLAAAALGLMNFDRGHTGDTSHFRTILFIMLFGFLMTFIFDMDHSRGGMVKLSQEALFLVRKSM